MEGKTINENEVLVNAMNKLTVELSSFRAEMQEFKKTAEKKLEALDKRQLMCQVNPGSCANARKLEEHIKADNGRFGKITGIIGCVIACFNFAVLFIKGVKN